jgi:hypothetical protein
MTASGRPSPPVTHPARGERAGSDRVSTQITHRIDPETRAMVQLVTPTELRRILRRSGDTLDRPRGFGPADEWDVGDERDTRHTDK